MIAHGLRSYYLLEPYRASRIRGFRVLPAARQAALVAVGEIKAFALANSTNDFLDDWSHWPNDLINDRTERLDRTPTRI
jgi:hypothetical protein